jgi:uncharacterized protein YjbJ (UPF0337 family)
VAVANSSQRVPEVHGRRTPDGDTIDEEHHMSRDSGPTAGAKGVVEDIKGKAKEVAGKVTDNESLEQEGRAQQDKADSQREVAEHEAKADKARAEAAANEARQRAHQDD